MQAGFLDELAPADSVLETALATAKRLSELPAKTYAQNKLDIRRSAIDAIEASL